MKEMKAKERIKAEKGLSNERGQERGNKKGKVEWERKDVRGNGYEKQERGQRKGRERGEI